MEEKMLRRILFEEDARFYRKVVAPEFQRVRDEMKGLKEELKDEMKGMATKTDLETFRQETERNFSELRGEVSILKTNHERRLRRVETKLKLPHYLLVG